MADYSVDNHGSAGYEKTGRSQAARYGSGERIACGGNFEPGFLGAIRISRGSLPVLIAIVVPAMLSEPIDRSPVNPLESGPMPSIRESARDPDRCTFPPPGLF